MRKRMNVYITTGKKNICYAYVAIKSLFMNNRSSEVFLYIVSEDLEETDLLHEKALAEEYGHRIILLRFDEERARQQIHLGKDDHWAIGTMSSYWLFHELLPQDVDRIMVIESDTVIVGDLSDIYSMDFGDNYVICPGPEHKPRRHREFMESIGGECLTFVLSMYNVPRIRKDFTLEKILETDTEVKRKSGYSQMEFTFGLLFRGHIGYVPGKISCIDENERYMEELGYDYIVECEKTAKILHFSSYSDYGKPWNPVSMMPGFVTWWEYAQGSPYYKTYFERQWEIYAKSREKVKRLEKNVSYRNILICANVLAVLFFMLWGGVSGKWYISMLSATLLALAIVLAAILRKIIIAVEQWKCERKKTIDG